MVFACSDASVPYDVITTFGILSWSPAELTRTSKSRRLWPCQIITSKVFDLLDLWISSAHWARREAGATMRVPEGGKRRFGRLLERKAFSIRNWRGPTSGCLSSLNSSFKSRLVCIKAEIMMVFPIPTGICLNDRILASVVIGTYFLWNELRYDCQQSLHQKRESNFLPSLQKKVSIWSAGFWIPDSR